MEIYKYNDEQNLPAHAGVILGYQHHLRDSRQPTRTRGGDPNSVMNNWQGVLTYPHTRG